MEFLEKFQEGLVGVVGFAGVIWALYENARLARKMERDNREHKKKTLIRALLAELNSIRESLDRNAFKKTDAIHGDLLIPPLVTPIFDANIGELGLLSQAELDPALEAYLTLKEHDRSLLLFSGPSVGDYFSIKAANLGNVVKMIESLDSPIDNAIKSLRKALSM